MTSKFVKLAYQLGYKQALEDSNTPLFDPKTGLALPDFARNFSVQQAADSSVTPAIAAAGSAYMAGHSFFGTPISQSKKGVFGLYNKAMNYINPERAARVAKPVGLFKRLGRGSLWSLAAAIALSALAYKKDWV